MKINESNKNIITFAYIIQGIIALFMLLTILKTLEFEILALWLIVILVSLVVTPNFSTTLKILNEQVYLSAKHSKPMCKIDLLSNIIVLIISLFILSPILISITYQAYWSYKIYISLILYLFLSVIMREMYNYIVSATI